jgi:hypothetical protein
LPHRNIGEFKIEEPSLVAQETLRPRKKVEGKERQK